MKQFCFTPRTVALNIHTMLSPEQWLYSGYIECLPLDIYDNLDLNACFIHACMMWCTCNCNCKRFTYNNHLYSFHKRHIKHNA